jgi:hypothetical protein
LRKHSVCIDTDKTAAGICLNCRDNHSSSADRNVSRTRDARLENQILPIIVRIPSDADQRSEVMAIAISN